MSRSKTANTIFDLLRERVQQSPDAVAYAFESEAGWEEITWRKFWQRTNAIAWGLRAHGVESGDHVGLLAPTGLSWELMHHAILRAGGVVVGLEPHDTPERLRWIADHARLSALVVDDAGLLAKIGADRSAQFKLVVQLRDGYQTCERSQVMLQDLETQIHAVKVASSEFQPNDAATLIYTSGTTGQPKGILYRHDQVVLAVRAIANAYPSFPVGARFVCWLPLSNLFQRIMNLVAMHIGGQVFLVGDPLKVMSVLPRAKPDVFIGVPRFYEKLYAGIQQEIARKPLWMQRVVRWAVTVGARNVLASDQTHGNRWSERILFRLAKRFVLAKLGSVMGGSVRFMVTGSAPTPTYLLDFFSAIGLPLFEAYGMSENVVPVALNRPTDFRLGTVGKPLPENNVMIDASGELLIKGEGVFNGYFRDHSREQLFDSRGYYRTGDYASFDSNGYLRLHGRKTDIIKTSGGRRISALAVESALQKVQYVDRAIVVGNGRKCLSAFLTFDAPALCRRLGIAPPRDEPFSTLPDGVLGDIRQDLEESLVGLSSHERPGAYIFLCEPLTIEGGEITPNLKVRRHVIEAKHMRTIDAVFASLDQQGASSQVLIFQSRLA